MDLVAELQQLAKDARDQGDFKIALDALAHLKDLHFDKPELFVKTFKQIDTPEVRQDIAHALQDGLGAFLEGAKGDLKTFFAEISKGMLAAQASGRVYLADELLEQIKGLAEVNRIRLVSIEWDVFFRVLKTVFKAVVAVAAAAA